SQLPQVPAFHFGRLFFAQYTQHGRGDVLQRAVWPQLPPGVVHQDEGDRVGGVISVGGFSDGIDYGLRVAVIGADDPGAVLPAQRLIDRGQAPINHFDGARRRLELAGVADHIRVGEIHDDDIEIARVDRLHDHVSDAGRAHLRPQVVSRDLW